MAYSLPDLPYGHDALEPHIDARTMSIHHGKHHQGYVNNLNNAVAGHNDLAGRSAAELILGLDSLPAAIRGAVRNNGGGHVNHSIFWGCMSGSGGGAPSGELGAAIDSAFGSFDDFKAAFAKAGATQFGSGWAWLCVGSGGSLSIVQTPNQDNPIATAGAIPILGIDVWEHAYYLNYQNRRPDYIAAFWNVVDWPAVATNFAAARGTSLAAWARGIGPSAG